MCFVFGIAIAVQKGTIPFDCCAKTSRIAIMMAEKEAEEKRKIEAAKAAVREVFGEMSFRP